MALDHKMLVTMLAPALTSTLEPGQLTFAHTWLVRANAGCKCKLTMSNNLEQVIFLFGYQNSYPKNEDKDSNFLNDK